MTISSRRLAGASLCSPSPDGTDHGLPAFAGPQHEGGPPPGITSWRDERRGPIEPATFARA